MSKKRLFLGLILSMCFTVGISAQDTKQESADKQKIEKQDKDKKKGKKAKKNRLVETLTKAYEKAELTDDQKKKLTELVEAKQDDLKEIQKEMNGLMDADARKERTKALKKAKEEGKKGDELAKAGFAAAGLSEEDQKTFTELTKKRSEITAEIKEEFVDSLTDDQKKAIAKKGKKGKGKKGDKPKKAKTTSVAINLPGMT